MILPVFPSVAWVGQTLKKDILTFFDGKFEAKLHRALFQYQIGGPNSTQVLQIPVEKKGSADLIKELKINYDHKWIKEHWNALQTAYGKSPFYEFYDYKFKHIFEQKPTYLIDFNLLVLEQIFAALQIDKKSIEFVAKENESSLESWSETPYYQVFEDKFGFRNNLSVLDLIFNLGPMSSEYFNENK